MQGARLRYVGLATDYDGTLATDGAVDDTTHDALQRLAASGRSLILVTGRELDELLDVFPRVDIFDIVVAENGALLYRPKDGSKTPLGERPPDRFVEMLRERGVERVSVGDVIVATWEPHQDTVLGCIRELGLELHVIFNKGAVMILPSGVNKASGLAAALLELGLSTHNIVGIGDAENDHAFLAASGCAFATANALPSLKERCDVVTQGERGAGVVELIERVLENDLSDVQARAERAPILLGHTHDETAVALSAFADNILIAGPSGSGKSTLTTAVVERLIAADYQACVIDPEGDYTEAVDGVVLGDGSRAPLIDEVLAVLARPNENVVVNLLGLRLDDRPAFLESLMPEIQQLRARTGRPHRLIIDEAHHMLHPERVPSALTLPNDMSGMVFITLYPEQLVPEVLSSVGVVITKGEDVVSFTNAIMEQLDQEHIKLDDEPAEGDALLWQRATAPRALAFAVEPGSAEHSRHIRKYAEGELREDLSFYFRGPQGKLNLRAHNLDMFLRLAEGVDEDTWMHHLRAGDYSKWFREVIKDDDLAAEVEQLEQNDSADTRAKVCAAIEKRYTAP
jgi:HAD superfamily hydrolase (TIGR01484 family)